MALLLVELGGTPGAAYATVGVPAQNVEPPAGEGPEFGKASPIALVVILMLGLATALLIVSMTRHLKKVPASFDSDDDEQQPTAEGAAEPRA